MFLIILDYAANQVRKRRSAETLASTLAEVDSPIQSAILARIIDQCKDIRTILSCVYDDTIDDNDYIKLTETMAEIFTVLEDIQAQIDEFRAFRYANAIDWDGIDEYRKAMADVKKNLRGSLAPLALFSDRIFPESQERALVAQIAAKYGLKLLEPCSRQLPIRRRPQIADPTPEGDGEGQISSLHQDTSDIDQDQPQSGLSSNAIANLEQNHPVEIAKSHSQYTRVHAIVQDLTYIDVSDFAECSAWTAVPYILHWRQFTSVDGTYLLEMPSSCAQTCFRREGGLPCQRPQTDERLLLRPPWI